MLFLQKQDIMDNQPEEIIMRARKSAVENQIDYEKTLSVFSDISFNRH